jgi:hypothetical protein
MLSNVTDARRAESVFGESMVRRSLTHLCIVAITFLMVVVTLLSLTTPRPDWKAAMVGTLGLQLSFTEEAFSKIARISMTLKRPNGSSFQLNKISFFLKK